MALANIVFVHEALQDLRAWEPVREEIAKRTIVRQHLARLTTPQKRILRHILTCSRVHRTVMEYEWECDLDDIRAVCELCEPSGYVSSVSGEMAGGTLVVSAHWQSALDHVLSLEGI